MVDIDCNKCPQMSSCCQSGVWVDLEEAKTILDLGIKKGVFHHLEIDDDFPSGFKVAPSYDDVPCSFLDKKGLCKIHKIGYDLKPRYCKEYPFEDGKPAEDLEDLCIVYRQIKKNHKK